jgi:Zn-dependent protease
MSAECLNEALIQYLMLIALLTFHEYGHAWMAWRCGDDTARLQGRLSLNPLVHIDPIGTVLMPLLMFLLPQGVGRFLIGGAKPVPINPYNFRQPSRDDLLVTLAGPGMNLALAVILLGLARLVVALGAHLAWGETAVDLLGHMAELSLYLCFFNLLLPVPPLDGSRVWRVILGISHETYAQFTQYGFIPVVLVLQIPGVMWFIGTVTDTVFLLIVRGFGM